MEMKPFACAESGNDPAPIVKTTNYAFSLSRILVRRWNWGRISAGCAETGARTRTVKDVSLRTREVVEA
jgi:hypothetical protein